jgi:arylsulfatase A-like enzyme
LVLTVAAFSAVGTTSCRETIEPFGPTPNIILILTDDQDIQSVAQMPTVQQRLVSEGLTFRNFFVTTPVCCPSRLSILRGQYAHNHGVWTNTRPDGGWHRANALGLEESTIATWLQARGYRTAFMGKYLNGYYGSDAAERNDPPFVPPGWDEWFANGGGYFSPFVWNGVWTHFGSEADSSTYTIDVIARHAGQFLDDSDSRPFFLMLSLFAPHDLNNEPPVPAARHSNAFAGARLPRSPSFDEEDVTDKPRFIREMPRLSDDEIALLDRFYQARLASLLAVDELVRGVLMSLEGTGKLANTFVLYTSDNGIHLGEHRLRFRKNTAYEEAVRVPLIVRGPGVPRGSVTDAMVMNIDLAPTMAQLASARSANFVDGDSFVSILQGAGGWEERAVLLEALSGRIVGLRKPDKVFVEWFGSEIEYYLQRDPYQLASRHQHLSAVTRSMLKLHLGWLRNCSSAECR